MKIFIGADHRGVGFKRKIMMALEQMGYEATDLGAYDAKKSCDYPKIAREVATAVASTRNSRGVLVCMSGIGQAIAANKVNGAYAALCYNSKAAKLSRQHNNANILVMGSKFVESQEIPKILRVFLNTAFEGGRHQRRVNQIKKMERGAKR